MCKVLVVDDDKDILTVIKILLTIEDNEVEILSKGDMVHQTILLFKPHVILLDINLGAHDGRNICREIKTHSETKNIPVILFTATHKMHESAAECLADEFIEKPFDITHLMDTVNRFCN